MKKLGQMLIAAAAAGMVCAGVRGEGARTEARGGEPPPRSGGSTQDGSTESGFTQNGPAQARSGAALIPRALLFGNPERARAMLSPDGSTVAYLAPGIGKAGDEKGAKSPAGGVGGVGGVGGDGALNVWVAPVGNLGAARAVTRDATRGIRQYQWAHTGAHILYLQDQDGDENWHVYSTSLWTGATIDLTPFTEIPGPDGRPLVGRGGAPLRPSARLVALSPARPTTALVAVNNRDPRLHDLFRVDITSGAIERIAEAPENTVEWVADHMLNVRYAIAFTDDGGQVWLAPSERAVREPGKAADAGPGAWTVAVTLGPDDAMTTGPVGFTADNTVMYVQDSRDRDTAALCEVVVATGEKRVLASSEAADLANILVHPETRRVQAACFNRERADWVILDESVRADFVALAGLGRGDVEVVSRSRDDRTWLVLLRSDNGPSGYYLYRRGGEERATEFLFWDRPALKDVELAMMKPVRITTRDGLEMVSYLTRPVGTDEGSTPLPMVLLVHGGPWARDEWGYNAFHQLFANRGYAVLSVNFRGSTGFGKMYLNASRGEWAGKMHDDLIDAVDWAVRTGVADREKVAIVGGSYGGYAALVGLTFTPDVFACGVSVVGPSNLVTLLESIPEYWKPGMAMWRTRVGDVSTPEGREFLLSRSPLKLVDRIRKPLLIGHGANDPRVKLAESDQIVAAMKARQIPVTYVVFPDEGHGFLRPENRVAFWGIAEAFLSRQLGGRCEDLGGVVRDSSAEIRAGAEGVPGLAGTPAAAPAK
ncbi:MAG: S9 family peptidase [Phycisphaeraceae bacterium]|nr:S9 family peptidase [Phycisphaeraceae bacterium]